MMEFLRMWQTDKSGEHILNPDHLPNLIEPRALALVSALESCGAHVFASCAGHDCWWWQSALQWPHFAFRLDLPGVEELAACLHENTELYYRWWIVGHFVRRFDFTIGYALTIRDSRRFDMALVDHDLHWLSQHIQNNLAPTKKMPQDEEVAKFMQWVQEGLQNGMLPYNRSGAMVHFVPEGMLLVSPAIFKRYAGDVDWIAIQKKFNKSDWPIKAKDGKFIWSYQMLSGKKSLALRLNGFVVDSAPFVRQPPSVNPYLYLAKITKPTKVSPESAAIAKPKDDKLALVAANLNKLGNMKPRTLKALTNVVASIFPEVLPKAELSVLVQQLQSTGKVCVSANKVTYP